MVVKSIKLKIHNRGSCDEELVLNLEAFPKENFRTGDIVEIRALDEQAKPLYLKVKDLAYDLQQKGGPISVLSDVAQVFGLTGMKTVSVTKVDRECASIDLVELTIKDHCLSRSDMWRFSNSLMDSCVYTSKKIQSCEMRAQVHSLWSKENTVDSGLVHSCTRVLFRSNSVHIFICLQICAEMWEFDANGTVYFDKALLGFLKRLFDQWTKEGCSHYVTVVFFSRTYYLCNTTALSDFPTHIHSVVQQDYRGVYYRDFFEVILEGQQSMDWATVAKELKRCFKDYRQRTDCSGDNNDPTGVKGVISRAPQGNVLECLNLTSNVFAKKYVNPSFHLTGQQTVIITPGVGVFEVDRELARITNERMMDFGISSDIVSLTEQPLHAVPLFKFQSTTKGEDGAVVDDYTIPHWINYSYYDPSSLWSEERFQPRIRLPDYMVNCHLKEFDAKRQRGVMKLPSSCSRSNTPNMFFRRESDFDDYDAKVFLPATKSERNVPLGVPGQASSPVVGGLRRHRSNEHLAIGSLMPTPPKFGRPRLFSNRDSTNQMQMVRPAVLKRMHTCASESGESPSHSGAFPESDLESTLEGGTTPQSPATMMQPRPVAKGSPSRVVGRPFINPFQPNELPQEISTNKRRWMHAFPTTSKGHAFQPHHAMQKEGEGGVRICCQLTESGSKVSEVEGSTDVVSDTFPESQVNGDTDPLEMSLKEDAHSTLSADLSSASSHNSPHGSVISLSSAFSDISVGDVEGEVKKKKKKQKQSTGSKRPLFEITTSSVRPKVLDNFAPIRRTGVDWKALTSPACLPVTTDYFPSERTLADDYTVNLYTLLPLHDAESHERNHPHLTAVQCFRELISQRLSKGFQIVLSDSVSLFSLHETLERIANGAKSKKKKKSLTEGSLIVKMSLGRVCHFLTLTYPSISVAVHRAKHTPQFNSSKYSYSLQPSSQSSHQAVQCEFDNEKMEYYNWNYLDQHIMGYDDFDMLSDALKYCHSRYLLLPGDCSPKLRSMEAEESREKNQVAEFVRFLEFLNHLRRPSGHSRRGSTDSQASRYSSVASRESLAQKFSLRSRHSSQLSLLQLATGSSITEVDEGRSRTPLLRTPSYDTSNPSSRPSSPAFYQAGSPHPRSSSADRGTPLQRVSSVEREDSLVGPRHLRRSAVPVDEFQEKELALVEREESEVSPERDSPSPHQEPLHNRPSQEHEDKEKEAGPRGGEETPTLEITIEDSSTTLVKSELTGVTVTEASPLIRKVSTAPNVKNLDEGRVPQTDTFTEIVETMLDTKNSRGIDFVFCQRSQLRSHCFIAIEAVEWFKEYVEGVHTSEEAVQLGQHMVDKGVLVHASGDRSVCFEAGFYLFCIADVRKTPESSLTVTAPSFDHSYVIIEGCLNNFRRQWFEAGIVSRDNSDRSPLDESPSEISVNSSSPTAPLTMRSLDDTHFRDSSGSGGIDREWTSSRTVDLNPDPHGISDRPEWCTVIYDSVFIPQVAFQMEFQWVVTTATLLAKQISQWSRRAEMCGFHLLPVPTWQNLEQNPFSKPQCIPLLFNFERLHDMGVSCDSETMFSLVHNILKRFGFLLDPSSVADDMDCLYDAKHLNKSLTAWLSNNGIGWHSNPVYVHHSGACLVKPMKQSCSPLSIRTSSSTTGYLPRTDSECTIQASTPLGLDYDDVFSARRFSRSSRSSLPNHSKLRHSTPCTSPDHAPSPGGMNAMYSFLWYTNNLSAMQKPSSASKSNVASLLKEFQEYCASVNDHFEELLCHRELTPYNSIKSTGSNV